MSRRNKNDQVLASSLNNELSAGAAPTQAMSNVSQATPRQKLGDLVTRMNAEQGRDWGTGTDWQAKAAAINPTEAFSKGKTAAYPVASTRPMPNMPGGESAASSTRASRWGAVGNPFEQSADDKPAAVSPVTLKGSAARPARQANQRRAGQEGPSLIHSTIRAMELLGEHEGNNKKVIESMVNR